MERESDGAAVRLCLEDVTPGRAWVPQQTHLSPKAAEAGQFGGLVASGWQTACRGNHVMSMQARGHARRRQEEEG